MGMYQYPRSYPSKTVKYSMKKDGEKNLSEHFKVKEFQSKDGADTIVICPDLITELEALFKKMNAKAINITSGYRTISHSKAIGGAGAKDNHHLGMAADIKVKKQDGSYYSPKDVAMALQDMKWEHGIGLMSTALHVDTGNKYWFDETKKSGGAYVQVADWYSYFGKKQTVAAPKTSASTSNVYQLTCDWIYVRTKPNKNAPVVCKLYKGQKFNALEFKGEWIRIGVNRWIGAKKYSKKV